MERRIQDLIEHHRYPTKVRGGSEHGSGYGRGQKIFTAQPRPAGNCGSAIAQITAGAMKANPCSN